MPPAVLVTEPRQVTGWHWQCQLVKRFVVKGQTVELIMVVAEPELTIAMVLGKLFIGGHSGLHALDCP